MQLAYTILLMAMSLLQQVNSTANISPELRLQAINTAHFAIDYANRTLVTEQPIEVSNPVTTTVYVPVTLPVVQIPQTVGSAQPLLVTNPIMESPKIECTLTAESKTAPVSSLMKLTWSSKNTAKALIKNSRVDDSFVALEPVSGGTKLFHISSESGEDNVFTARFYGIDGKTVDCQVTVITQ